ncbi:MAG TPA: efflux RND transporter periplasmic adaptor subunit [Candidatus Paceibacterota bacterium]|nr:efflux RND transporter periplasmic adaptor subunit [Candidatus Paceibacterota bacterium]
MKKFIYIGVGVVVAVAGYFIYQSKQTHYSLATVTRGPIVQQVLASGNVQSPTTINLNFQNTGEMTALDVSTGENVGAGEVLARQDATVLAAQLQEAQASVAAQTATLNELEAGATPQTVAASQAALTTAEQTLANTYAGIPGILADAYAKTNDGVRNQLAAFFTSPESSNPQLTFSASNSQTANDTRNLRVVAGANLNAWTAELASTTKSSPDATLDAALQTATGYLSSAQNLMNDALTVLTNQDGLSPATVTAYTTSATTGLNEVNAAIAEVNTAEANIASDEAAVAQAQAQLNVTTASSTPQAIEAQQALVAQAQASAAAIQAQIAETVLTAPADGVVTQTNGSVGATVTPAITVVSVIPNSALEIKLNVSEDNIVGVQVGQPAQISLDAFPDSTTWTGKVVAIDPAQTTIGGAIYYQTTVLFDQPDARVKPGMTANVLIQTGAATSTLLLPASAIQTNGTSTFVELYQNGKVSDENVTTGLTGQNGMIEITSGVSEGQQVVTGD